MFPPKPTKDPYELLTNLWLSLGRASDAHWSHDATIVPGSRGGYIATLRFASPMTDDAWTTASKYMRSYARASHWKVGTLKRHRGYAEMHVEHSPPKPKKKRRREQRPASQKTEEGTRQDQGGKQTPQP